MTTNPPRRLLASALVAALLTFGPAVSAQQQGTPAERSANLRATADMRSRLAAADDRIVSARQHGKLAADRAVARRLQIATALRDMAHASRQQGFVSAGELASYARLVVAIDAELAGKAGGQSYGNDALPSAEVTAFQKLDARLHYRKATIERDWKGCAVYQGTASDGRLLREPLRDPAGRPICLRR